MKRCGFSCQRPDKRAYGRDIARVETFKKEEYPAIVARAKAENAEIYWGDEPSVSNSEDFELGFAEKGHPPVLSVETKRERANMISAITSKGHVRVYGVLGKDESATDFGFSVPLGCRFHA